MNPTMGQRIKARRRHVGLTQEQLAEKTKISARHISRIETGRVEPSPGAMAAIAAALFTTVNALKHGMTSDEIATLIDLNACPTCHAPLSVRHVDTSEDYEREYEFFDCGAIRGEEYRPCPQDPDYPAFENFELAFFGDDAEGWLCIPKGRTEHAARMRLGSGQGRTRERAAKWVEREYLEARYSYKEAERRIPQMSLFVE